MSQNRKVPYRLLVLLAVLVAMSLLSLQTTYIPVAQASSIGQQGHGSPWPSENYRRLAATPFMGWSSWSLSGSHVGYGKSWMTASNVEVQSDAMHQNLQRYGYDYINLDAFWYQQVGSDFAVDAYGRWTPDTQRFPDIGALSAYIHHNGQQFGLYLVPGIPKLAVTQNTPILGTSCYAQDIVVQPLVVGNHFNNTYKIDYSKPCAQAYIDSIARQLHAWGANFLKLDGVAPGSAVAGFDTRDDIKAYNQALKPYHIWLELSSSVDFSNASFWQQYSNGWRITGDIECYSRCPGSMTNWSKVSARFSAAPQWAPFAGPGGWNDLDSLDVGNGSMDGLSLTERQTYMTLWAISAAPLYPGDDLTKLDSDGLAMLTNREVIAQDQSGKVAVPLSQATAQQVWYVRNRDGSYTVALFNLASTSATVTLDLSSLDLSGAYNARDLWTHGNLGSLNSTYSVTLDSHGSQLLRLSSCSR